MYQYAFTNIKLGVIVRQILKYNTYIFQCIHKFLVILPNNKIILTIR